MSYRIVYDSCCDFPADMTLGKNFKKVSLYLELDGTVTVDDDSFNQLEFIERVNSSKSYPKSSCPSPQSYMEAYVGEEDNVYVFTLSSELSGSYNSALIGLEMYEEEYGKKNIHIFDSRSASIGEAQLARMAIELEEKGLGFEKIVKSVEEYRDEMRTFFVLETLETFRKNGRLSGIQALAVSVLNIRPVMGSTPEGNICKLDQARGVDKALIKMIDIIVEVTKNAEDKVLAISHCNCIERAMKIREEILKKVKFKAITIAATAGVSTMYANNGGIIVAV